MFKKILLPILLLFTILAHATDTLIVEPDDGTDPIIDAIRHAKASIDVVMYGFTDRDIQSALIQAAFRGVNVHVILQKNPYKAEKENRVAYQRFNVAGISLAWNSPDFDLTHQKTMIIDNHTAYIMTFNFTESAFKDERNFGYETDNATLVSAIKEVFDADWNHTTISPSSNALIWSPDNGLQRIRDLIDSAKKSIDMYAQSISDPIILNHLKLALKQRVRVNILLPASAADKYCKQLTELKKAGANVHLSKHYYIHAKAMLIDYDERSPKGYLGSANFTAQGLNANREVGIVFTNHDALDTFHTTFEDDWNDSTAFSSC